MYTEAHHLLTSWAVSSLKGGLVVCICFCCSWVGHRKCSVGKKVKGTFGEDSKDRNFFPHKFKVQDNKIPGLRKVMEWKFE